MTIAITRPEMANFRLMLAYEMMELVLGMTAVDVRGLTVDWSGGVDPNGTDVEMITTFLINIDLYENVSYSG